MRLATALALLIAASASAQTARPEQTIRPDERGYELVAGLADDYAPATVFSYGPARDTLFLRVDLEPGDSLRCVYTGRAVRLDRAQDPTRQAYESALQISTEHTWPQSRGAGSGAAKSDLHHLFAVTQQANSSRSNDPFAEIDDAFASRWFGPVTQDAAPDPAARPLFSETTGAFFEPRHDHKGDAARAMFYFYTLYRAQADTAWFEAMVPTLLEWHEADPATAADSARSARIAAYQGTHNPYVLDATLAARAFVRDGGTLPVVWGDVAAVAQRGAVLVRWQTLGETGNAGFTVETQGAGAAAWRALGRVAGAGSTLETRAYAFAASGLPPGVHRFRIQQTDLDGAFAYSPVTEAHVRAGAPLTLAAAPNPFGGRAAVTVHLDHAADLHAEVFDALGRRVAVLADQATARAGTHRFDVDGARLAAGVYVVRVRTGAHVATQTLVRR